MWILRFWGHKALIIASPCPVKVGTTFTCSQSMQYLDILISSYRVEMVRCHINLFDTSRVPMGTKDAAILMRIFRAVPVNLGCEGKARWGSKRLGMWSAVEKIHGFKWAKLTNSTPIAGLDFPWKWFQPFVFCHWFLNFGAMEKMKWVNLHAMTQVCMSHSSSFV